MRLAGSSISALSPYLDEQWAEFVRWTNFKIPGGVSLNYLSILEGCVREFGQKLASM